MIDSSNLKAPDTKALLDDILSSATYENVDTAALRQRYDSSSMVLNAIKSASETAVAPTPLTTSTFSSIPDNGLIINTAGTYTMTKNCTWSPTSPGAAITIQANDVVLDLGGNAIFVQLPSSAGTKSYNGINVSSSLNITVQNGTVSGAGFYGVQATFSLLINLNKLNVSGQSYENKTAEYATPSGIFMGACAGIQISDCSVSDINVLAASCAGIQLIACSFGTVNNCSIGQLNNQDGGAQGFSYLLCEQIHTTNGSCNNFTTQYLGETTTTGHTSIGFVPIYSKNLHFNNCSSTDITGCCDDAHGMSLFLVKEITVNNFKANGVTDGPAPYNTGAKATGLEVYGDNIQVNNSHVSNICATVPQDLQAAGFSAWGDTITFKNCTAENVQVLNAAGQPDSTIGHGTGYGWAPDPRTQFNSRVANKVQYINCTSNNCQLGCDTWNHTNSVWTDFTANTCAQSCLNLPAGAQRTLTMDKCSERTGQDPSSVTITNQAANNTVPACCG